MAVYSGNSYYSGVQGYDGVVYRHKTYIHGLLALFAQPLIYLCIHIHSYNTLQYRASDKSYACYPCPCQVRVICMRRCFYVQILSRLNNLFSFVLYTVTAAIMLFFTQCIHQVLISTGNSNSSSTKHSTPRPSSGSNASFDMFLTVLISLLFICCLGPVLYFARVRCIHLCVIEFFYIITFT